MDAIVTNQPLTIICKAGEALQIALSHRDEYTQNHCQRVAFIAIETGKHFGFDRSVLQQLETAAIFHDIGKIGMPDDILLNPSKLTDVQFDLMKTHSVLGASIAEKLDIPDAEIVADIIRHHHEHYDGSGYPDGLKGEEISLASRIICVVDVFDALSSRRCYRDAISPKDTLTYMAEEMIGQFDPLVFEVVSQVIKSNQFILSDKEVR
jgi:putative nucleotidyltransferase with HDIG domain